MAGNSRLRRLWRHPEMMKIAVVPAGFPARHVAGQKTRRHERLPNPRGSRVCPVAAPGNDGDAPRVMGVSPMSLSGTTAPTLETSVTRNPRGRDASRTRGVTLLELLVAMAIGSVTLVVSLQLYVATQRAIGRQQVKAARLGQESDLLSLLRRDIREASLVAPESTESRLVLVNLDGGRLTYETEGETVRREAPKASYAWPVETIALMPRFEYPSGRGEEGRLVRVRWGPPEAPRALTLNLRNRPM